ncbi:MAG: tRNA 2-thiocytidine biosynthesis protein TtcA [Clostridiales bacterium]|nr:tRNA 2-thiocytidine biosynthesis protein TtcA [Clostridiales bacterium]
MQELLGLMRAAAEKYDMIDNGDRIAVGVSGGKDSLALLVGLCELRRFYGKEFSVTAITADMCFGGVESDYSSIQSLCDSYGIEYVIKRTQLGEIIFDVRREENPCSLCARMRRGILHDCAKAAGCNKIALGHHLDDAAETFMMNLLNGGRAECFAPVTYLSRKDITMIRPMIFAREAQVAAAGRSRGLVPIKSKCPADGVTNRQRAKELLAELDTQYGKVPEKIIGALERGGINGW